MPYKYNTPYTVKEFKQILPEIEEKECLLPIDVYYNNTTKSFLYNFTLDQLWYAKPEGKGIKSFEAKEILHSLKEANATIALVKEKEKVKPEMFNLCVYDKQDRNLSDYCKEITPEQFEKIKEILS